MVSKCTYCGQRWDTETPCILCPHQKEGPKSPPPSEQNQGVTEGEGANLGTRNLSSNPFGYTELSAGKYKYEDAYWAGLSPQEAIEWLTKLHTEGEISTEVFKRRMLEVEAEQVRWKETPEDAYEYRFEAYYQLKSPPLEPSVAGRKPDGLDSPLALKLAEEMKRVPPSSEAPVFMHHKDLENLQSIYPWMWDDEDEEEDDFDCVADLAPVDPKQDLEAEIEACQQRINKQFAWMNDG